MYPKWKGFSLEELYTMRDALGLIVDASLRLKKNDPESRKLLVSLSRHICILEIEQDILDDQKY